MPIPFFSGDTFVAFTDIVGFKAMMKDGQRAIQAIDAFYRAGYSVLDAQQPTQIPVHGLFVSDCAVLFVRGEDRSARDRLVSLCNVIRRIHRRTFSQAVQLTS